MSAILGEAPSQIRPAAPVRPVHGHRFTLDGDERLESHLTSICSSASNKVQKIVPPKRLEGLFLGGGYGRGEGGVLTTTNGDLPYNDLEFYVFIRGNRFLNRYRFGTALERLGETMTPVAGADVEFHISSYESLRRSKPSMFYYDLVMGHRPLLRTGNPLKDFSQHRNGPHLPLAEATRLLMNRGTGLLLARERLEQHELDPADNDFVMRNIAKAQLALGDAVLTAFGQYHWSCRERQRRLATLAVTDELPWLAEIRRHHAAGVEFKLHPHRSTATREVLKDRHQRITSAMLHVWLWLESRRLQKRFNSVFEYVTSPLDKCPETNSWRNLLLNARVFGFPLLYSGACQRHPRERILTALAILLWDKRHLGDRLQSVLGGDFNIGATETRVNPMVLYQKIWRHVR